MVRTTADGSEGVNITYEGGCSALGLVVSTRSADPLSLGHQVRGAAQVERLSGGSALAVVRSSDQGPPAL